MNRRTVGIFLGGLVVGLVILWGALALLPRVNALTGAWCVAPNCVCQTPQFEVAVHQGPDAGLEVEGKITYAVNLDGTFNVIINGNKGEIVRGRGQAVGRSLDMVLVLPDDRHMYAHGTLDNDIRECNGGAAGPATGPTYGDIGDWGSNRPPFIRVISGTR